MESPELIAARKDLGIYKHLCLTIQNLKQAPSKDELLDILYTQLDSELECGFMDFG